MSDPLSSLLTERGAVVLDGGLATELEDRGHLLDDSLWSARLLVDAPEAIFAAHLAYLRAGADCVTTATYQASYAGFARLGLSEAETDGLLRRATELARAACEAHRAESAGARPLVAASVGPYGAFLADGSEYDGRYGVGRGVLEDFHRRRLEVLASSGADLLACETIPSLSEAEVLLEILDDHPGVWAWMTFSCRDDARLRDGSAFVEAVSMAATHGGICAVGVNCTDPGHAGVLAGRAAEVASGVDGRRLPVVVYANSGERWDAAGRRWHGPGGDREGAGEGGGGGGRAAAWRRGTGEAWRSGARVVGGCCRVGPAEIAWLRGAVDDGDWSPSTHDVPSR